MPPAKTTSPAKRSNARPDAAPRGYTVLARRYRSRDFDELIGQEPIARTLQNAIATGRLAHAYLFCGTRGVGKTSMARIFAKALNVSPDLQEADAIAEAILRGDDLDVIEIDGASNSGVNEARDLIAGAGLSPARCKYKIYIIDEVHALSKQAFNALLKTMEEPPAHVKFVLCTTEAIKVPVTIQSRCQRFDFRPISSAKIAKNLKIILDKEGIQAEPDVIAQVARLGQGSMRDALSTLDRLLAAADGKLTTELLEQMLGLPDHQLITSIVDAVAAADPKAALEAGNALLSSGTSVEQAVEALTEHFRTLLVASTCGQSSELLDVSSEMREVAARQIAAFDGPSLVYLIAICDSIARHARYSAAARALYDAALVRMATRDQIADAAALLRGDSSLSRSATLTESKKKDEVIPASRQFTASPPPSRARPPATPPRAEPATVASPPRPPLSVAEVKPPPPAPPPTDEDAWTAVRRIMSGRQRFRIMLDDLEFESMDGDSVRLTVRDQAATRARMLQTEVASLNDVLRQTSGRPLRVIIDASRITIPEANSSTANMDEVRKLPAVAMAMSIFGAVVTSVETLQPSSVAPATTPAQETADV